MKSFTVKFAALLALSIVACGKDDPNYKYVTLGLVIDRTGPLAMPSTDDVMTLAAKRVNAGLTKANFKSLQFNYIVNDNAQDNPTESSKQAVDAVTNKGAKALITDSNTADININMLNYTFDATTQSCVATNALDVPIVCQLCSTSSVNSPTATDADPLRKCALRNSLDWNFVTSISQKYLTPITARIGLQSAQAVKGCALSDSGCQLKIGTYAINNAFGQNGTTGVINGMNALNTGGTPIQFESIYQPVVADLNGYAYGADISALTDNDANGVPQLIVATLSPDYEVAFTKAYVLAYLPDPPLVPVLHSTAFQAKTTIDTLGSLINGQECVSTAILEGESGTEFAQLLQTAVGYAPQRRESLLYDSAVSLMLATVYAVYANDLADPTTVTGAQIRDGLRKINDPQGTTINAGADMATVVELIASGQPINYEGASGPVNFDSDPNTPGRVLQHISHLRIENEQWVELHRYDCVSCPAVSASCPVVCPEIPIP